MSNIEEKLWEYIDGTCTPANREAIEKLIATDETYRHKYEELLAFNQDMLAGIELDEPPMAFTYNVMEAIRTDYATQHPLKTQVNKTLVRFIGGFFIVSLLVFFGLAFGSINWSAGAQAAPQATHLPDFKGLLSGSTLKVFLFFDTVLLLFLLDGFMRKRMSQKQA
jgi:anti-sigma factor RsiW